MSEKASNAPVLRSEFATALPELSVHSEAARPEHPEVVALNEELARELGLDPEWLRSDEGVRFLLGNEIAEGSVPVAQAYAGHQFGGYSPRLGDGRALLLGEIAARAGEMAARTGEVAGQVGADADAEAGLHGSENLRDLHLKGSGPTPFSRGDGFAALGPMLREYLMCEAMHALGIPTTRALAVVATGRRVIRDEGYTSLPGAVLARVASSHLRVGTFQYALSTGDHELLRRVADFAIERHHPELAGTNDRYLGLLKETISVQAKLVASWMHVGFVHGVMNTDNTTISGETIDYGPCAFIDAFDPAAVFSSIDARGRYAYGNQPNIMLWNLTRFAESLLPLIADDPKDAERLTVDELNSFGARYNEAWLAGMRSKLGLVDRDADPTMLSEVAAGLLSDLGSHRIDYTSAFRALAEAARGNRDPFLTAFGEERPGDWFEKWLALQPDPKAMDASNPLYIPRNHLVDEALALAEQGDLAQFEVLLDAVVHPFAQRDGLEKYERPSPSERRHVTYCGT